MKHQPFLAIKTVHQEIFGSVDRWLAGTEANGSCNDRRKWHLDGYTEPEASLIIGRNGDVLGFHKKISSPVQIHLCPKSITEEDVQGESGGWINVAGVARERVRSFANEAIRIDVEIVPYPI